MLTIVVPLLTFGSCVRTKPLSPEALALREQHLRELLRAGTASLRQNRISHAEAAFQLARELHPEDPRALDGLGCVAWRKRNVRLAEHFFVRAAAVNPEYDRPVAHLALVAEARGHHRAARELLRRAIRMNPLSFRWRNNFAAVLLRGADGPRNEEAYRELLKAFELAGPDDPVVRYNLGNVLRESE